MELRRTKRTEKRFRAGLAWTKAEVARLVELYPETRNRDLAVEFGRSVWGIKGKIRGLGLENDYARGYRQQYPFKSNYWSEREEELLAELFPTTPNEEISERIGRSLDAIANKARKMGLRKMEFWSEDEDELLKKLYKELSYEQLTHRLERTTGAIQIRITTLGMECKVDNWTKDDIDYLKKSYSQMTYPRIAKNLGRTWTAVAAKAGKMGFTKYHHWYEADVLKLNQLYTRFTVRQIANIMGRSYSSVRNKIKALVLCKNADVYQGE